MREAGWSDANTALPLGVTLGRLGEFDAAKVELQKARENGADPVSLDYNLALLLKTEKKFDEAREKLISVRENGEGDLVQIAHREFLRLEIDTDRVDGQRAKELLDECWELSDLRPSDWRVFELLGDLFMIQEDPYAAKGAYENALKHGRNPAVIEDKYRKAAQAILDLEGETAQGR